MDRTRRQLTTDHHPAPPEGTIITGWVGRLPEDAVVELAAEISPPDHLA